MKYEVLKTALKKMECHRSTRSRNNINTCSTKTYQKGPTSPSKLELQLTMSLGIKKIYERQRTKSIKRVAEHYLNSKAFQALHNECGSKTVWAKRLQNIVNAFQNEFAQSPLHLNGIASLVLIPKRNKKKVFSLI